MQKDKLITTDQNEFKTYIDSKFQHWKKAFYITASSRKERARTYYGFVSDSNKDLFKARYLFVFQEQFIVPLITQSPFSQQIVMMESDIEALKKMRIEEYQGGPDFLNQLQIKMEKYGVGRFDKPEISFETEFLKGLHGEAIVDKENYNAQFDFLCGMKQTAKLDVSVPIRGGTDISAKLEQSFTAGAWGSGSAQANFKKLQIGADAQIELFLGANFEVTADCIWKRTGTDSGLTLSGKGSAFAGATASGAISIGSKPGSLSLSANALDNFHASIQAGAFAGLKAQAEGSIGFQYAGENVINATGSVYVSCGVGADFSCGIQSGLFGATSFNLASGLTFGIGSGADVDLEINFTQAVLMANDQFYKLIYLPTIASGYRMDLMTSDKKNLIYLNKSIDYLEKETTKIKGLVAKQSDKYIRLYDDDDD